MTDEGTSGDRERGGGARRLLGRSLEVLRGASQRSRKEARISLLKVEIHGLRGRRERACRELGERVVELVRYQGEVSAGEIQLAIDRIRRLDDEIDAKTRRIRALQAEGERPAPPSPDSAAGAPSEKPTGAAGPAPRTDRGDGAEPPETPPE